MTDYCDTEIRFTGPKTQTVRITAPLEWWTQAGLVEADSITMDGHASMSADMRLMADELVIEPDEGSPVTIAVDTIEQHPERQWMVVVEGRVVRYDGEEDSDDG